MTSCTSCPRAFAWCLVLAATACGGAGQSAAFHDAGSDAPAASQDSATSDAAYDAAAADGPTEAPVVAPCSGLTAAIGSWQNITPPAFTSPPNLEVYTVVVNPKDDAVFASAGNVTNAGACPSGQTCPSGGTGILKSQDCGATWTPISDETPGTPSANFLTGALWSMLIDPVDTDTMYVANGYGTDPTIYKSVDEGIDWVELNPDPTHAVASTVPPVQSISIDPSDHNHLAITFHADCAAPWTPWCFSQSTDGGSTWQLFNGPTSVPGFTVTGWSEGASISVLGATSYIVLSANGVYYTGDGGSAWTLVMAFIDPANGSGSTYVGPDGTLYIGNSEGTPYTSAPAPGQAPPWAIYQAPMLPVPMPRLPYQTGLAPAVTPLGSAPPLTQFVDDGVNLYGCVGNANAAQPFWTAPLASPASWTQMPDLICNGSVCRGANEMAVDYVNHVIYGANWGSGLWRIKTR